MLTTMTKMSEQQETFSLGAADDEPANNYAMRPDMPDEDAAQQKKRARFLRVRSVQCLEQMTTTGQLRWLRDLLIEISQHAEEVNGIEADDYLDFMVARISPRVNEKLRAAIACHD